jgi:hypothetical protein
VGAEGDAGDDAEGAATAAPKGPEEILVLMLVRVDVVSLV